jgi:hypothetical protein
MDLNAEGLDPRSYYVGRFAGSATAWCEAARSGAKEMSLSSPFPPEDHDLLLPHIERAARENEARFYLEKTLMTTDLFADVDMTGKWVFVIYKKDHVIEDYLTLKAEKERLEESGEYAGEARRDIAVKMGRLLGYDEDYIIQRMESVAS